MGCCSSSGLSGAPRTTGKTPDEAAERDIARDAQETVLAKFASQLETDYDFTPASESSEKHHAATSSVGTDDCTNSSVKSSRSLALRSFSHRPSITSQHQYADLNQTLIIFDWDDTLCPSTCLRRTLEGPNQTIQQTDDKTEAALSNLVDKVSVILNLAQKLGQVVIVTNAVRPWVQTSCNLFMPGVQPFLRRIPVIYALESLQLQQRVRGKKQKEDWLTETKVRAMRTACHRFYSRYNDQSWKNVLSLGDAFFEHNAIRQVVADRPEYTSQKKCRTKTVKLIQAPTISGLSSQLSIISSWLVKIVRADGDLDIDLESSEEKILHWASEFKYDSSSKV